MRMVAVVGLAGVAALLGCTSRECCYPNPCDEPRKEVIAAEQHKRAETDLERRIEGVGFAEVHDRKRRRGASFHRVKILALSGGGLFGAFGAGLLDGWFADRPEFDLITGISTGALQAPFVYVNTSDANDRMATAYKSVGATDLFEKRSLVTVPFSSSLATAEGLERHILRWIDNQLIDDVAAVSRQTRRILLIGTTNLDTGCLEIWDMGRIAEERNYALFRKILLASSAVPAALPPVCINGQFHADGGTREQVFTPRLQESVLAGHARRTKKLQGARPRNVPLPRPPVLYIVLNKSFGLFPHCTQPQILDVGVRSVAVLMDEAKVGCIWKSWGTIQLDPLAQGCDDCFRLVSMPKCALGGPRDSLDLTQADMRRLFEIGRAMAHQGIVWRSTPDGLGCHVDRP